MILDSKVWGPHYWFFLHTIAITYPLHPNTNTKKRYYDFLHIHLPLFIPIEAIATHFSSLLNEYPVTPYLDSRDSFIRWMHFIHNKINQKLEKPTLSLESFYTQYYEAYKPKEVVWREYYKMQGRIVYAVIIAIMMAVIFHLYSTT